jgi:hypothetical protein
LNPYFYERCSRHSVLPLAPKNNIQIPLLFYLSK